MSNLPLDFGTFEKHGGFIGSHAIIILSQKDSVKDVATNLIKFLGTRVVDSALLVDLGLKSWPGCLRKET